MSFNLEFYSKIEDVPTVMKRHVAPECVKEFIRLAVQDLPGEFVHVEAMGHLFSKDYNISNATIKITPINISSG